MLLPMPAVDARAISLERHLALVMMRSTDVQHSIGFARLNACSTEPRRTRSLRGSWSLPDAGCAIVETILALHDQQLASAPAHLLMTAQERLNRFIASNRVSSITPDTAVHAASP
jgi:hypothetical protein